MRGAVPVDKRDVILLEQSLRKLERVADGRRGADELRMRPIEGAYPLEPADHVGDLAAEQTAIRVELIDDDELEAGKQSTPSRVMWQQAGMQHVGVRHHDMAALADRGSPTGRCVAVVGVDADLDGKA